MIRTFNELMQFSSFEDRFSYLKLHSIVGHETFGFDRWLNQVFYTSDEWKAIRRDIILRDNGCDLGVPNYDISGNIIVHHMNPITVTDIVDVTEYLLNPDYLISTSASTHRAIHFGNENILSLHSIYPVDRHPNDTCPWKEVK